jgi:hemolysin III
MSSAEPGVVRSNSDLDAALGSPERPSWRGRLHLLALVVVLPLLVLLAVQAGGARSRAGVIVYAVGLCSMFAVSTTYHRFVHTVGARSAWRRADHATIFAAIGGTMTALVLATLGNAAAIALLIAVWLAAALGAVVKAVGHRHADRIGGVLYIGIGWSGIVLVPSLWSRMGAVPVVLLVAGGLAYTIGAAGFARRWPTLRPATFSYHEVWHVFTIVAAALHLTAVWNVAA